jgi:hypothetical protein
MSYQESDPRKIDTDGDGIFDNLEDKNKNGVWEKDKGETCAYNVDSDNDGLWDGYDVGANKGELTIGTDPLREDTDGDGLKDGEEVKTYFTNPLIADTDYDLLPDGKEKERGTNPFYYDTDKDGLSDGEEVYGRSVLIVRFQGGEVKTEEKVVTSDPLFDESSTMDTDGDGITDYDENNPPLGAELGQYDPYVVEPIPPKITNIQVYSDISVKWEWIWIIPHPVIEHSWAVVNTSVEDVAGVEAVNVVLLDTGAVKKASRVSGDEKKGTYIATMDIDFLADYLLSYTILVIAVDINDNTIFGLQEVKGLFGGFLPDIVSAGLLSVMFGAHIGNFMSNIAQEHIAKIKYLDIKVDLDEKM